MCYVVNKQYNLEAYFGHPGDAAGMVDHVGNIGQNNVRHSQVGTPHRARQDTYFILQHIGNAS